MWFAITSQYILQLLKTIDMQSNNTKSVILLNKFDPEGAPRGRLWLASTPPVFSFLLPTNTSKTSESNSNGYKS